MLTFIHFTLRRYFAADCALVTLYIKFMCPLLYPFIYSIISIAIHPLRCCYWLIKSREPAHRSKHLFCCACAKADAFHSESFGFSPNEIKAWHVPEILSPCPRYNSLKNQAVIGREEGLHTDKFFQKLCYVGYSENRPGPSRLFIKSSTSRSANIKAIFIQRLPI